jgi:hypothetical protein
LRGDDGSSLSDNIDSIDNSRKIAKKCEHQTDPELNLYFTTQNHQINKELIKHEEITKLTLKSEKQGRKVYLLRSRI